MSKETAVGALIVLAIGLLGAVAVAKIIDDSQKAKRFVCPSCGSTLRQNQKKCPNCGILIRWA